MTTRTSDRLASELRKVAGIANSTNATIYRSLADRAESGEFDDYGDMHVCGPTALWRELVDRNLMKFAARVAAGEFDATAEESELWARSQTDPQTVAIMDALGIGPDRSGDH